MGASNHDVAVAYRVDSAWRLLLSHYSEIRKWRIAGKAVALLWQALSFNELEGIMVRGTTVDRFG